MNAPRMSVEDAIRQLGEYEAELEQMGGKDETGYLPHHIKRLRTAIDSYKETHPEEAHRWT